MHPHKVHENMILQIKLSVIRMDHKNVLLYMYACLAMYEMMENESIQFSPYRSNQSTH